MTQPASRRFWIANAAIWAAYGLVSIVMARAFAGGEGSSGFTLISIALAALLYAASGMLRRRAVARGWLDRETAAMAWRLLVAVALLAAMVQVGVAVVLQASLRMRWVELPYSAEPYSLGAAFGYWINTVIILGLWTAAWAGWRLVRRARQSELATLRAQSERHALELDALRARLNPHFVFNALNNLRALILEDPERARELVTRLSSTLRHALEHSQREWTSLGEEVGVVRDYLAVEQVHYEERLRARIDVPEGLHGARLPPMALQLLVENAIKHGISRTAGGGELLIGASLPDGRLVLRVAHPGRIAPTGEGTGVGLAFLRQRLDTIAGRFSLEEHDGTVVATLEIPQ
jgi:hypothetical protein